MQAVDFERLINGFPASGAGIAYVGFGNNAKVFDLKISWRNFEPINRSTIWLRPNKLCNPFKAEKFRFCRAFADNGHLEEVKTLTITNVTPRYELKPGEDAMDFATPILQLTGVISNGQTTRPVVFQAGIFQ